MRKWRVIGALLVPALLLAGIGAFLLWPRASPGRAKNFSRIQLGMSLAEVEAVFGPPGDHTTEPIAASMSDIVLLPPDLDFPNWPPRGSHVLKWVGDDAAVSI